jgi:hypothetical protein
MLLVLLRSANNAGISIRNAPENLIQDNLISGNAGVGWLLVAEL